MQEVRRSYDAVAAQYAARIAGELEHKPFDRALLERFADSVGPGPVWDVGCGPGHVAAFLARRGVQVVGVDLSPRMVEEARRLFPELSFQEGDLLALQTAPGSLAGIVAFYSLIHLQRAQLPQALQGFFQALRPGGRLLLGWHAGSQTLRTEELWGTSVSLDAQFYELPEMVRLAEEAGFAIVEAHERASYPEVEYPSRRGYLLAQRP